MTGLYDALFESEEEGETFDVEVTPVPNERMTRKRRQGKQSARNPIPIPTVAATETTTPAPTKAKRPVTSGDESFDWNGLMRSPFWSMLSIGLVIRILARFAGFTFLGWLLHPAVWFAVGASLLYFNKELRSNVYYLALLAVLAQLILV